MNLETQFRLRRSWAIQGRGEQHPPEGDWLIWLFLGGRGAGKTRAGAEWIRTKVDAGCERIALIGAGQSDVREIMIEGPSGLLSIGDEDTRPHFEASRKRLVWPSGAVGYCFSGEDPDGLRGPQFDCAWLDEFAAWRYPQQTLDTLRMGLRLGDHPQMMITTTPRPIPALKALIDQPGVVQTQAASLENADNLAPGFIDAMQAAYGASYLARQELDGILIEDPDGALWTRDQIDQALQLEAFEPDYIVVAVDPPASAGPNADECGIVVAGRTGSGRTARFVVLADGSCKGRPEVWAKQVATRFDTYDADQVIAEANQGGDMVRAVLKSAQPDLPVRLVHASRGKRTRAEPVAALYAAGRVRHAGRMTGLEDQMCTFGSVAQTGSPDRVDALVWAISALMGKSGDPRVRRV